jgi:hypothetical protein
MTALLGAAYLAFAHSPANRLVETLSRFKRLTVEIAMISAASAGSS